MSKTRFQRVVVLIFIVFLGQSAWAHPISISWAEMKVSKKLVHVRLRILAEDLYLYHQLESNEQDIISYADLQKASQQHKAFIKRYFYLKDERGAKIVGDFKGEVELSELPESGIAIADLMEHSLYYEMQFPLAQAPSQLIIYQQFGGIDNVINAIMMLEVSQEGAGMLSPSEVRKEQPFYLSLDWQNANKKQSLSDRFAQMKKQKAEQNLGINSYSALYSFIYITDFEVRHEILIPLVTLETWFPIKRTDPITIEVAEQEAARNDIEAFFQQHNPVEVDGIDVKPLVERIEFYGLNFKDFAQQATAKPLNVAHARVGVILRYETKGTPNKVAMQWELFNEQVRKLKSIVYAFDENSSTQFLPDTPDFLWENEKGHQLPNIQQVSFEEDASWFAWLMDAFSTKEIPEEDATAIFSSLHKNIYRAFDYRNEEAVYDALAKSVSGSLLADLYLQIRKGLMMQEQGGAIARVKDVTIRTGMVQPLETNQGQPQFGYLCTWSVNGTVEHWGHIHERTNEYTALFTVTAVDKAWKITEMKTLNQRKVQFKTSIRQLW